MSVLVVLFSILALGYTNVLEAKEQLNSRDFLLDYLLSLWVPPNYTPSKFTRSIHDPITKEQMISIEKSKMALNNYINHLLRYVRENSNNLVNGNIDTSKIDLNTLPDAICENPEQNLLPGFGHYPDSVIGRPLTVGPGGFPSKLYDRTIRYPNTMSIYGNSNDGSPINELTGVSICPPADLAPFMPYPYGCQDKRDANLQHSNFQEAGLNYPDMYSPTANDLIRRIWYLLQPEKGSKQSDIQMQHRLDTSESEVSNEKSFVSARKTNQGDDSMNYQAIIENTLSKDNTKPINVANRFFEDWNLPGLLDQLVKNPPPLYKLSTPFYNHPPAFYNYNGLINAEATPRLLDFKVPDQDIQTRFERDKRPEQNELLRKKIEQLIRHSSDDVNPIHRFDIESAKTTSNSEGTVNDQSQNPAEKSKP